MANKDFWPGGKGGDGGKEGRKEGRERKTASKMISSPRQSLLRP